MSGDTRHNQLAVYVWKSAPWISISSSQKGNWDSFATYGVDRIMLSMDRGQIEGAGTPEGGQQLREALESAHRHGLTVDLLLGEPLWILPDYRENLLTIIRQLSGFAFDGLNLDLEPDQLEHKKYSREQLLGQLIETLEAVSRISPWPLGISSHPRYFNRQEFTRCLACSLEKMRASEIVLMVYVADPEKAASRVAAILDANPNLHFSVALSVEPDLSNTESYYHKGWSGLERAIRTLKSRLLPYKNFSTVVIQSWTYLEMLKP